MCLVQFQFKITKQQQTKVSLRLNNSKHPHQHTLHQLLQEIKSFHRKVTATAEAQLMRKQKARNRDISVMC